MKLLILISIIFQNLLAKELSLTLKEKEFIKSHPVITLGGGESFEPYLIKNRDGSISGYDVDIAQKIKEKTGLKIEFKLGNWSKIQQMAKDGIYDGISSATNTSQRENLYNKTIAYMSYTPLIIVF